MFAHKTHLIKIADVSFLTFNWGISKRAENL